MEVRTREADDSVRVAVVDNGPGIPETERAVITEGEETPLEHGSGLGLWAANWCVARVGGELTFSEREGGGSVVGIDLPRSSPTDAEATSRTGTVGGSGDD